VIFHRLLITVSLHCLLCAGVSGESATNTIPAGILLGTGTVQGYFYGVIAGNAPQKIPLQKILKDNNVPIALMKYYIGSGTNSADKGIAMSFAQELLDDGVSPVLLEHLPVKSWYLSHYKKMPGSWDDKYTWTPEIQGRAEAYLEHVVQVQAKLIATLKGGPVYYILSPEFTYVGDSENAPGYDYIVRKQIAILRQHAGDKVKIVRGYFMPQGQFEDNLKSFTSFIDKHPEQIAAIDYVGPVFHNQNAPDGAVAERMIKQLETVRQHTAKPFFIPYSYIRWMPGEPTDDNAAAFWKYFSDHRADLLRLGVHAWCLSATLEKRSDGSGLVSPTAVPTEGYAMQLVFSKGGQAFIDWVRSEAEYRKTKQASGSHRNK
jgi:hypothetical protein